MNVVAQAVKKALRALASEPSNGSGFEVRAVSLSSSMLAHSRKSWSGARGLRVVGRVSDRRFSGGCFDCCLGGHNRRVNKSDYTVRGRLRRKTGVGGFGGESELS